MEESIRLAFERKETDLRTVPVLNLAYVGDSVYELILRTAFTELWTLRGQNLHKKVQQYVCAEGQAKIAQGLMAEFTEEEAAVYQRGRNSHPDSVAKHASLTSYHKATGLEALIGYLYLSGRTDRAVELVKSGLKYAE